METTNFGSKLRLLRKKAGLSQRALAEKVGVDFSYLSKIENAKMPPPSTKVIIRLAEALQCDKDELLALAGEIPSDIAEILKNRDTLRLLRERAEKKTASPRKRIGVATMNFKNLVRVAVAVSMVAATGTSLWFAAPKPVRAFDVAMTVSPSPLSGNNTYLLGEKVTIPATVQFNSGERVEFQSVSINITGPESFSKELPIAAGTYTYGMNEGVPGNLNVVVGLTGTASSGPSGYGLGYGYGGSTSGNLTYSIKWTPPYVLTDPPPQPPPALPATIPYFNIPDPPSNGTMTASPWQPQGLSYDALSSLFYILTPGTLQGEGGPNHAMIITTDDEGALVNTLTYTTPNQYYGNYQFTSLTQIGATIYMGVNYFDDTFQQKGKVLKFSSGAWSEPTGLSTLNFPIGGLASDGTNLFIAYRDQLKIEKRSPSTGAVITTFDLSNAWGGGIGGPGMGPPIWGFDTITYDSEDDAIYASQNGMLITVDATAGTKDQEWKLNAPMIRGLAFAPYSNDGADVLHLAAEGFNGGEVHRASKPGSAPVIEDTPIGNYTSVFTVVSDAGNRNETSSFTLAKMTGAPTVTITAPSPNFSVGAGSEDITVSGSVDDPSISTVTVGVALPDVTAFQDTVENAANSAGNWTHSSLAGMNPWGPPYSTDDLWNRSDARSHAGDFSWRYANPNTNSYETNNPFPAANAGALKTANAVSIGNDNTLSFWTWYDTEFDFWMDRKVVEVSTDGANWQKVAWLAKFWPPFPPPEISQQEWSTMTKVDERQWTKVEVSLADFAGQNLYIRFRFDTMDDWGNNFEGWYIDDVNITGAGFRGETVSLDDNLQFTASFTLAEGENVITALATRTAYKPLDQGEATVTGSLDLSAPVVTLNPVTTPTNQQYQTISGTVVESNFDRLQLKVANASTGGLPQVKWSTTVLGTGGTFSQPILLDEGNNTISIVATDKLGLSDTETVIISLDTTGPSFGNVFPTSPSANVTYAVAYKTGESSARPGDSFFIALKVTDAANNVASVRLITPGDPQAGPTAIAMTDIPEAVIDSWGIDSVTKSQMNYVIPMQLPTGLPAGTYNWTVVAEDAAGNSSNQTVPTTIVTSLDAFNIYLMPDWNLVSLPVIPDTAGAAALVNSVNATGLFETIWYYDASVTSGSPWKFYDSTGAGDLTTLGTGKGYWLKMKPLTHTTDTAGVDSFTEAGKVSGPMAAGLPNTPAPVKMTIEGTVLLPQQVPPTYTIYAGWNLVGLHAEYERDINTALAGLTYPNRIWASLLEYQNFIFFPMEEGTNGQPQIVLGGFATDSTKFRTSGKMTPGQGYWLYTTQSGAIVP